MANKITVGFQWWSNVDLFMISIKTEQSPKPFIEDNGRVDLTKHEEWSLEVGEYKSTKVKVYKFKRQTI